MYAMKKLGAIVAVLALSAIGAANASAAQFTASATGSITGKALETQEFTINAGTVRCSTADISGTLASVAFDEVHAHVTYKNCTAFSGFVPVHNITATYPFTADGKIRIIHSITITVTAPFGATCHITFPSQTVGTVDRANNAGGTGVVMTPTVSGISYTTSGGFCGAGGSNGTYKGKTEITRVGGGFIKFDP